MRKHEYHRPEVVYEEVSVERGFALSTSSPSSEQLNDFKYQTDSWYEEI